MKRKIRTKRLVSMFLAVLMAVSGVIPAVSAFAADGVDLYRDVLQLFYKDTDTIVPSTMLNENNEEVGFIQYMVEGDELALTYKLIDAVMPDNGYIKWYSETPTLVDVTQEGVVKAFDSSKGAVIHTWIDNEVKTIPLVGGLIAKVIEKAIFNDKVNVDTMDTDAIVALVEAALGSDSLLDKWIESYKGELIDSLRYYLDNINSNVHVQLFDADGTLLADDFVKVCVTKNEEWYAAFLPNGTHITNKSSINTTVAVGSSVQLYAVTTPVRLEYGCIYSVKSSSVLEQGKVIATVDDSGLVTFKNKGTVTIVVSPDTEQVIQNILALINKFYEINGEMIDSKQLADILIKYVGIDMNRNVLAGLLDLILAVYDIATGVADPVKLAATAAKVIGNLVMQFVYNDSITFTVVDAQPLTNFNITGASSVREGSDIQLSITDIEPSMGDVSDITWRSSDPSIASVDPETGIITGRDAGGALGALSSQTCTIYAVSAANNIEKSHQLTVTGKTGRYLSDIDIIGEAYLEMGMETDYSFSIYPKRVAEGDNLYITWGIVTGEDEDGNPVYAWADAENPATDGRGSIDSKGHYTVVAGGESHIALMAKTGYYLSNGNFYEISNLIKTYKVVNGIPVESIHIDETAVVGTLSSLNRKVASPVEGEETTYVSIKAGTQYGGLGAVLEAAVYPENASNKNLTWVIDNTETYDEPKVSDDTHTATVTQKYGSHEYADAFNVYAVSADGLVKSNVVTVCVSKNTVNENVIDQSSIEITRGQQADATHTIKFDKSADGTYSACYKCNWYSSDESIFTVSPKSNDNRDAVITAVDVGTATLICVSADGAYMDTCEVTVYPDKEYLENIVNLCNKTVIKRTSENATEYKRYMNKLDLAYTVLYNRSMASQATCDTYADELLTAFCKLGGFVGILDVDIREKGGAKMVDDFVTVDVNKSDYTKFSYEFDFNLTPKKAMYSSVTWTSSDPSVTVDKNGVCRPTSNDPGAAIITCTVADYLGVTISDSVYIAFSKRPVTSVELNKNLIEAGAIGKTEQLEATVLPTPTLGIGGADNTAVLWSSSDNAIATVDKNGLVEFKRGGSCVITATTIDGGYTASCEVHTVTNYANLDLLVQQYTDLSLNPVNYFPDSWEVFSDALDRARNMLSRASSSQDEVDAMYAELEQAYQSLEKYNYIQKIELYLDGEQTQEFYQYDLSLLKEGISYKNAILDLNIRLYPNNGSYDYVRWESSTTDIAVTSDGKCSPTINGSCYGQITCTVVDHFGTAFKDSVWVSFSYVPVTSLELSTYNVSGEVGETYQLACSVYPIRDIKHPFPASIQAYYWESDDENVATVDQTGLITFVSAGATIVRAVSYDGGIFAECRVSTQGDRTKLMKALEDYKDVNYQDYDYNYGLAFRDAYAEAERARNDSTYTQVRIDTATDNLVNAYNNMVAHPFIFVEGIDVSYTTTKDPTFGGEKQVASGTVGSSDALSVNISNTKDYADYNSNNWATLTASPSPSNAMQKSIAWSTVDSYKADITVTNNSVKVKPKERKEGAWAILTVAVTDMHDRVTTRTIYVTLSDNTASSFSISNNNISMLATESPRAINYSVAGSPEFKNVIWSSSNTSVATVDANGNITPVDKGNTVIKGKTIDGGFTATVNVNVATDFSQLASKQNEYYNVVQNFAGTYTYTVESLDNLSAYVSQAATMINEGKATQAEVSVMLDELENAYNSLVIYVPVTQVSITAVEDDNVEVTGDGYIRYTATTLRNKSVKLKPVFNTESAVYRDIQWESSNPNIVVDEYGLVTNISATAGVAEITCTVINEFGGEARNTAYVTFTRYGVTGVSFNEEMVFGAPAQTVTLSPVVSNTGKLSQSSTLFVKECTYVSDNPSIAEVDENGVVTFITQGSATITATTKDGGFSATIIAYTTWDTTALKGAIDEAEAITYTDYSYAYGTAFNEAYEQALAVYNNVYASQAEIDSACTVLTEAINALEGNEFIKPEINLVQNGETLNDGSLVQVDVDTQQAVVSLALNEGAMIKSYSIDVSNESGATAVVNNKNILVTRTGSGTGNFTVTVTAIDDYDREYTRVYNFSVIETIIPATSIVLTANGTELGSSYTYSCGGRYTNFGGMTIGYIATPANANAITNVEYQSTASNYIRVDNNGVIEITTAGALRASNTTKITCTVTNADGTKVTATVNLTITRA